MAIGEVFLGAFLQVLFDRLASGSLLDFVGRFAKLPSLLEELRKKFPYIQAVLIDAEEKQITDRSVKKWMDHLQDLAYDLEDLLDELATKALKSQLMARNDRRKVWNLVPSSLTSLKFKHDMVYKIEKIISRLDELCKLKKDIGLKEISGGASSSPSSSTSTWQRPPTTSLSSASVFVGRDADKRRILDEVLQEKSSDTICTNIQVISIVGMGGLGKTTLVQAVYNDSSIAQNFDLKAWVCVSQDFDVLRISRAILKDITFSSCDSLDFNQVQRRLQDLVTGKKLLIVLDDVWSEDLSLWQVLKSPFMNGAEGSKIILTTRMEKVAVTMGSLKYHQLNPLTDDCCWSIFKNLVLESREVNAYGYLEEFHEKVVRRCKGLPLAVQSLCGLLRSKEISEWEDILSNKIWAELESNKSDDVLPVLRLSYKLLPSHLKRCFAYCAIFSEDYIFDEQELVLLWMAEGFIHESKDMKQTQDLGCEYFRDLLSRSFFQPANVNCSEYTMHDLIHELACSVSGETSFRLEDAAGPNQQQKLNERARHFSYKSKFCDVKDKFEILSQAPHLRTFLPLRNHHQYFRQNFISNVVVSDLLPKLKKLRAVSLKDYQIVELPESIKSLRHLRYLNLAWTQLRSLPESTSSLINLQTLDLSYCSQLRKLPSKMKDLVNLCYLNIKGACLISEMPVGMKEIKYLRFLSNFIVGKGRSSGLEDLKHLKFLSGELCVSGLENVNDIRGHILTEMKDLKVLRLEWKSDFDDRSRDENIEKMVLDRLRPHIDIEVLQIKGYSGKDFPSWVGDAKFSSIKILHLEDSGKCTPLPSFAQLDSLKELSIKGIQGVNSISSDFFNTSLETLCFENLQEWEHWESSQENQHGQKFLHISRLSIVDCPKLLGYLPQHLPSLQKLEIKRCTRLEVFLSNLPMICNLDIDGCRKLVCSSLFNSRELKSMTLSSVSESESCVIHMLQNVSRLKIVNCENFLHLWANGLSLGKQLHEVHGLTFLTELCIEEIQNLALFPESFILPNLKRLDFKLLEALTALSEGIALNSPHLEVLRIEECDSLKFIAKVQLPSLKELRVWYCKSLEYLLDDGEDVCVMSSFPSASALIHKECINNSMMPLLERLIIGGCSSLMSLSSKRALPTTLKELFINGCEELTTLSVGGQLPVALQNLQISICPKLQSIGERFDNNKYLERIAISNCKNLKSIPHGLHELKSLSHITIQHCASLDSLAERGLPSNIQEVSIDDCEKLQTLPKDISNLDSLVSLRIGKCPGVTSFVEEGMPTSLTGLFIEGDMNMTVRCCCYFPCLLLVREDLV